MKTALIIDTETTGLGALDEIIELGAILFEFDETTGAVGEIIDSYVGLREPSVPISRAAQNVHHILKKDVTGKKLDDEKINSLITQASYIIAHNADFDKRFFKRLYPQHRKTWLCTMNGIPWERMGHPSKALQVLSRDYRLPLAQAHRALGDCQTIYELLKTKEHLAILLKLAPPYAPPPRTIAQPVSAPTLPSGVSQPKNSSIPAQKISQPKADRSSYYLGIALIIVMVCFFIFTGLSAAITFLQSIL